jgi:hypothetical protein
MKLEKSQLVRWKNAEGKEIIWMVTDNGSLGVVVHSDGLSSIGTTNILLDIDGLEPFIGTVNLVSKADN